MSTGLTTCPHCGGLQPPEAALSIHGKPCLCAPQQSCATSTTEPPTPRCFKLRTDPMDSNDIGAWMRLAQDLEESLSTATALLERCCEEHIVPWTDIRQFLNRSKE